MDWAVLIGWAADGHYQWFYLSLTIQILSGLLSAGILIWELLDHMNGYVAGAISLIFGIGGFGPWVMVILALYTQQVRDAHASIELTKNIMLMELIFETLPQSMLQGYVAISYSMLDPINNADHFSALLFASLAMSRGSFSHTLILKQTTLHLMVVPSPRPTNKKTLFLI